MLINSHTKIKALLSVDQEQVIAALVTLNKNFSKLKNPVLRNLFASRITIAEACKISGTKVSDFLNSMELIGFKIDQLELREKEMITPGVFCITKEVIELDVRPVLKLNKDPLKLILDQVNNLKQGQTLKLINNFEPIPLINLLMERGFAYQTKVIGPDLVFTYFKKLLKADPDQISELKAAVSNQGDLFNEVLSKYNPASIHYLDVRKMEMPKPMLTILEHSENLKSGDLLFVYHKKKPIFLLPELEKKGLSFLFEEVQEGNVNMLIYKE
ncbi:MAG: DUF2249 domain-containing protein [Flavobacterium sp.]|nr:DUF2249 domain-containing protein [Pedobacter sp.]